MSTMSKEALFVDGTHYHSGNPHLVIIDDQHKLVVIPIFPLLQVNLFQPY